MSSALPFTTMDVFTDRRFCGNPLAVVEEADGLSDETMQIVAREFNLSETIFVQTPDDPRNTAKVRIFFPTAEIPFAGHPTIGCAIHLAGRQARGDDFALEIVLEEVAGLVPVAVRGRGGVVTAQLTAPVTPVANTGPVPDVNIAAAALGVDPGEIGFDGHAIGRFEGGPVFIFIPLASREALSRARPCDGWSRMTAHTGLESVYLYTRGDAGSGVDFHSRMFAPGNGIPEDPATGSASALLAGQLAASGVLRSGTNRFVLEQGRDMGRPSAIGMEADFAGGKLGAVRISGTAVRVSSGMIEVEQPA